MFEDSWLEMAYEDRNGSDVETDDHEEETAECSRSYYGDCEGELMERITSAGFPDLMCLKHLRELVNRLLDIQDRYPEVNHPDNCGCYGCSEGSY